MGTVPVPLDWAGNAGNLATAAMLQAGVGDPITFAMDQPGCQAWRATAQSIPNNTATAIVFDTEDLDNDSMHGATNPSRITCNTAGRYLISAAIPYDAGTTGNREARIVKNTTSFINGARVLMAAPGGLAVVMVVPAIHVSLAVGDFLELQALHTNGTALTTTAINGLVPVLSVRRVGA